MEKVIEARLDQKEIGFNSVVNDKKNHNVGEILRQVLPQDFVKFGMIPEIIGRVPMVVSLDQLDREALIRILKEPKNSIIKQYQKLFEMDGVELKFEPAALAHIAKQAIERKSGARGLRAIVEGLLMDAMFDLPSREDVKQCIITEKCALGKEKPKLVLADGTQPKKLRRPAAEKKPPKPAPNESSVS